jgi:hypothetical protein
MIRGAQGAQVSMARDTDKRASSFETENTGGLLSGFLAEEDVLDRRGLWRLGSWGVASVGAVVLAVFANQSSTTARREQGDLARQAEQIQLVAKQGQSEARRLASAIETLNGDRDRLYSRVTVLEQGLETVTGAIAKQQAATPASLSSVSPPAPTPPSSTAAAAANDPQPPAQKQPPAQSPAPAPAVSPVATTAPKPADKPVEKSSPVAAAAPEPAPASVASIAQKPSNPPATTTTPAAATTLATAATLAAMTTPAVTPATPLVAAKSMMGSPDAAATKLIEPEKPATPEKQATTEKPEKPEKSDKPAKAITATPMPEIVASAPPTDDAESDATKSLPQLPAQRTEFGVDVGGANSVGGLRALWRGLLKSRSNAALTTLRPIIVIREGSNGLGMQLRLVAGPLDDAAAAAKICAGLIENQRPCSTTVFDGQRLTMNADEPAAADKRVTDTPVAAKPATSRYFVRRRALPKQVAVDEPAKKPDPPSALSSFFRRGNPQ